MASWIFTADIRGLEDEKIYQDKLRLAPAWRRDRIQEMGSRKSRLQSLAAWLLLERGMECLSLRPCGVVSFRNGKPFFADMKGFDFSLSHSGNMAVCAAALSGDGSSVRIGADIEKVGERDFLPVAARFFTRQEYADICSRPDHESRKEAFYRYWTLKESCLKALGCGLSGGLNSVSTVFTEKSPAAGTGLSDGGWYFRESSVRDGENGEAYRLAVCCDRDGFEGPRKLSIV